MFDVKHITFIEYESWCSYVHLLCVLGFIFLCSAMARGNDFQNIPNMVQVSPFQNQVPHEQMPLYHVFTSSLNTQRGCLRPVFWTSKSCIGLA